MGKSELRIAFIGFGEAAEAFWSSLERGPVAGATAFDVKTLGEEREAMLERYRAFGVIGSDSLEAALSDADVVFSVVTADAAHQVAREAAPHLAAGALFLDCNSCAPQTKQQSARAVEASGGRYVDVAVMSPVNPLRNRTPLLLSGDHAGAAKAILDRLDMNATVEAGPVGKSSSVKMVRSIMIKGMEALFAECFLAGRLAGVDDQVLASLEASHPGFEWARRAGYNLERMALHGVRRGAEMEEVCAFLNHLGIDEPLSASTARWQTLIGELGLSVDDTDYRATADRLIDTLKLNPMKEA